MLFSNFKGVFYDAAGDGGGSGTGAGTGTGTGEAAKAPDVNKVVNDALTRFTKETLPGTVKGILDGSIKPLNDQFSTITQTLEQLQHAILAGKPPEGSKTPEGKTQETGEDGLTPAARLRLKKLEDELAKRGDEINQEKKTREAVEQRERNLKKDSAIRGALDRFEFTSPEAKSDAFNLVAPLIEFDVNGELTSNDKSGQEGLTLELFLGEYIPNKKAHLLAQAGKGGAGASAGAARSGPVGSFQIEQIKPGMSTEDYQKAASAIARSLKSMGYGTKD